MPSAPLRQLYPAVEPFRSGHLRVSDLHDVYYEESGNPEGKPVVFLHGGPGGGTKPDYRRLFDARAYRIVLFDQRGCGRSRPHAELRENTTWDLVADMERIRAHLGIERWQVFGGSWGSTLALAYAETHPERVSELILRGIFLIRPEELAWFYQDGCSRLYPDAWEKFIAPIPEAERADLMAAYHKRLTHEDERVRLTAARAWSIWEGSTLHLRPDLERVQDFGTSAFALAFARIECHYFVNRGFFDKKNAILANVHRFRHIPGVIVQGRYDVVCPPATAWDLHRAWPEAEFHLIQDAGHAYDEPGILDALIGATDRFRP